MQHCPVLLKETIKYLNLIPGQTIVDGTFGFGGHGKEIAKKIGANGRLIGIEQDERTLKIVGKELASWPQIQLVQGNFADVRETLGALGINEVDAVLLDLGISSYQIETGSYGLSWQTDAPLDMRLSGKGETALELMRRLSEKDLADLLYQKADEYRSRRIARAIKEDISSIKSTMDLANAVARAVGGRGKIHPATKTFQALRLAVNQETENLEKFFSDVTKVIKPGGRLVTISFHSGEDRIIKHEFKKEIWQSLTKKPVQPTQEEILANPRARSAKLRCGIKR